MSESALQIRVGVGPRRTAARSRGVGVDVNLRLCRAQGEERSSAG